MNFMLRLLGVRRRRRDTAPTPPTPGRAVRARFDSAQTTTDNRRHWAAADSLSANAAVSPGVRATLRQRGRHEQANNPYIDGISLGVAVDAIGNGPTLRLKTPDKQLNTAVEQLFHAWASVVELAQDLRVAIESRISSGECFVMATSNPRLAFPIKLDVVVYEPDQIANPRFSIVDDPRNIDGVLLDAWQNPVGYQVLRRHPGDVSVVGGDEYDIVPADRMFHLFIPRRPGQKRGYSQLASSLDLSAHRRGMRASVMSAARVAAELGAVMVETDVAPDEGAPPEPFETVELERGMMTVLPAKSRANQMRPEQPSTTFGEFDDRCLQEQGRPLQVPFNMATGNSRQYNYASTRADHQVFDRTQEVLGRGDVERKVLDPLLRLFLTEALMVPGLLPTPARASRLLGGQILPSHEWLWSRREHVDPAKEANAQGTRLGNRTATLAAELAKDGTDLEGHIEQLATEAEAMENSIGHSTLDQGQVSSAVSVLTAVTQGRMTPTAATELLVMSGVPRSRAEEMTSDLRVVVAPPPRAGNNGNGRMSEAANAE